MTTSDPNCVFCAIVSERAPATILREWDDALAIKPRGGVNDGHTLVIPRTHVADAIEDPEITADTVRRAAQYAAETGADLNLITNVGPDATQTVFHLHWHIVPRAKKDGLLLPWTKPTACTACATTQAGGTR
ncbi:HIT domain-containing protein [Streptomyces sp. BE147]|uniref:HIT family protein n=1 Tax=Streptomyces sp. BE147 TaxID=3002524 RepID=UPI002E780098|nr:HIT domain-containing protein [Streptomyces sp. BE147]MEE1735437.1 HIT domain-containing protein [Streptomyces sp. BE147]